MSPELAGGGDCYTDIIRPMGVYAHEFGHILGLPDLYDRDDSDGDSNGLGNWCLMASGSWLGWGGDTPAHMSSWCKLELGWLQPEILLENAVDFEIPETNTQPFAIKIWEDDYNWSRYFLIENRQAIGFDSDIRGNGLLIYHIDENRRFGSDRWSSGPVNDNSFHKFIDLEEADGLEHLDILQNRGDDGDPFPGTTGNIAFNQNSNPNSNRYNGDMTGISVENISLSDTLMTAKISVRDQKGYAISYDENGISGWGFGTSYPQDTYGAVLFTPNHSGYLSEIDVGVKDAPISYQVLIYDSFSSNSLGNLLQTKEIFFDENGWHSVSVDTIFVEDNIDFFISVKINSDYAISYDRTGNLSGKSYYSTDGINYSNNISNYGDINIRAKILYPEELDVHSNNSLFPKSFLLYQNYPNPFNPNTLIQFELPMNTDVSINIYNLNGKKLITLINSFKKAGFHSVQWNGKSNIGQSVSTGVYIYSIEAGSFSETKKMVLLK